MEKRGNFAPAGFPPEGFGAFFLSDSDEEFKRKHPVGYFFTALLGIAALIAPMALYGLLTGSGVMSVFGLTGTFIIGFGLFNLVAMILGQYLGHLVSVACFLTGGGLVVLDWVVFL